MRHDLDAINAAIRLGDAALPPLGSIIEVAYSDSCDPRFRFRAGRGGRMQKVQVHRSFKKGGKFFVYVRMVKPGFRKRWILIADASSYICPVANINRIVELPADAPPYAEWKRDDVS